MTASRTLPMKSRKESEVDRVYRLIKGWILQCEFRPGEFVAELELARLCKSSRTPVREACSRISQEQWLQRIPNRGYLVPAISAREIIEVYEFRVQLEGFAAERAARVAGIEDLERLAKMIAKESQPGVLLPELIVINDAFHLGVAGIARNHRVLDQLRLTLEYVHRLDVLSIQRDSGAVPHGDILDALRARRPAKARRAMTAHVAAARDRMVRLFGS
jgi:DNA-binding GntR family transcriptional regulator